jgi:hypothetical protein
VVMRLNHLRGKGKAEDGASVFFFPLDVQLLVIEERFRGCVWEFLMSFGSACLRFRFMCKICYFEKRFCSMRWLGVFQGPIRS